MKKETATETTIIVLEETKELKRFDQLAVESAKNMVEMCILAHKIVGDDKEKKRLFTEHVEELGLSRFTANQIITAGKIYVNNESLQKIERTNVVELNPVTNEVGIVCDEFYTETHTNPEKLAKLSQKKIRAIVNKYRNPKTEDDTTEDDATEETTEDATEEIVTSVTVDVATLEMVISCLESIDARYSDDMEKDDLAFIHDTLKEIRKVVK